MRKLLATSIIVSLLAFPSGAQADNDNSARTTASTRKQERAKVELYIQMLDPRTAPISYWHSLAKCETGGDWKDGGQWAGGLGVYQRTWYEFGGYDYAKRPQDATRIQQIVIANRIAVHGYKWKNRYRTWADKQAGRGMVKYPHRYFGWGCAALHTGNPCGKKKDGSQGDYHPPRRWSKKNCHNT